MKGILTGLMITTQLVANIVDVTISRKQKMNGKHQTPKQKVLDVHPKAYSVRLPDLFGQIGLASFVIGYYFKNEADELVPVWLGSGKTATLAWRDAANRLTKEV
jgi:hypothetical protein